ncbi:hypothetical protein [Mycoplasma nasistruthionis]|uniref:Uncharacterized protein n=1 Tax=Mycoplasma nasistruthionis TaxID=353852 RepID=A0A5B7XVQ4_9MOLU|nr:hypothetical protein [Mycoplasma nasistruthionis]QCZ36564.1 hypothetical protein FG904_00835 [Mycoplasma nasistruthionis]
MYINENSKEIDLNDSENRYSQENKNYYLKFKKYHLVKISFSFLISSVIMLLALVFLTFAILSALDVFGEIKNDKKNLAGISNYIWYFVGFVFLASVSMLRSWNQYVLFADAILTAKIDFSKTQQKFRNKLMKLFLNKSGVFVYYFCSVFLFFINWPILLWLASKTTYTNQFNQEIQGEKYLEDKSYFKKTVLSYLNNQEDSTLARLSKSSLIYTIQELAISGIALALFLLVTTITKTTGASKIGLSLEYIFYIVFALLLPIVKAMILAVIADFSLLLFTGRIWSYYWMYALVGIVIVLITKGFIYLLKNKKLWSAYVAISIIVISFIIFLALYIYVLDSNNEAFYAKVKVEGSKKSISTLNTENPLIRISETFGFKSLSSGTLTIITALVGLLIFLLISFTIILTLIKWSSLRVDSKENQNTKVNWINKKLAFASHLVKDNFYDKSILFVKLLSLVISIFIIVRWLGGPILYINYANAFLGRTYTVKDNFVILMIPIVLRSGIAIPVYTFLLLSLYGALSFIQNNFVSKNKKGKY